MQRLTVFGSAVNVELGSFYALVQARLQVNYPARYHTGVSQHGHLLAVLRKSVQNVSVTRNWKFENYRYKQHVANKFQMLFSLNFESEIEYFN